MIDISVANAVKPAGLAYAPSSVDPSKMNLYIVDRGVDNGDNSKENDGKVYEVSFPPLTGNQPNQVEVRVATGKDDAEEKASGSVSLTSADLELVYDGSNQTVGLRFQGVTIPTGATVTNAYVQFQVDEKSTGATSLLIEGQATVNPPTFSSSSRNISNRPRTFAAVPWVPESWPTVGEAGLAQQTPNLAAIFQELIEQSGWNSGQAVVLIITGTGKRVAEAYEGGAAKAPLLHVEYSLEPVADLTVLPTSLDFGTLPVGTTVEQTVTLRNDGAVDLDVTQLTPTHAAYTVVNDPTPLTLEPGASQDITVRYSPGEPGLHQGNLQITSTDPDEGVMTVALMGTGVADEPDIEVTPLAMDFGAVVVNTTSEATVTLRNFGTQALTISSLTTDTSAFTVVAPVVPPTVVIGPGGEQVVTIRFAPISLGSHSGTLTIGSDDPDESLVMVTLQGFGTDQSQQLEVRVATGTDDAEEKAGGSVDLDSSDLELVYDGNNQTVGLRFQGVTIPAGVTITTAYVQFTADEASTGATSLLIEGEATVNPPTFSASSRSISTRPRTLAAVSWTPAPWSTVGAAGLEQQTPNLAAIIQELVNQEGWSSGQAVVLLISGTGKRVAESYEGSAPQAPLLHVEYTAGP
jgi:hypothetical protein